MMFKLNVRFIKLRLPETDVYEKYFYNCYLKIIIYQLYTEQYLVYIIFNILAVRIFQN